MLLYLCASPMTTPLWVPGGWKESAGTYSFYFEFVHLLAICVFVHYGVQELDLVWVRFICEFNGVV